MNNDTTVSEQISQFCDLQLVKKYILFSFKRKNALSNFCKLLVCCDENTLLFSLLKSEIIFRVVFLILISSFKSLNSLMA